jgi:tetratricopeptide (TPR) repeat protein
LEIQSVNINALFNLGFCYETKKNYAEAFIYYKRAVEVEPRFKEAFLRMGTVKLAVKEYPEAKKYLQKALKIDPDYLAAHYQMGIVLSQVGQPKEALAKLELVAKTDPNGVLGKKAMDAMKEINEEKAKSWPKAQAK